MSFQTLSVAELPYLLPETNAVYHAACRRAASARLSNQLAEPLASAMRRALAVNGSKTVWAIVIENDGQPMYVVQNLKYTLQEESQRRIFRVRLPLAYLAPSM